MCGSPLDTLLQAIAGPVGLGMASLWLLVSLLILAVKFKKLSDFAKRTLFVVIAMASICLVGDLLNLHFRWVVTYNGTALC